MQVLKNKTDKSILAAAKKLFLANQYNNVSMRDISSESGVGLSNIYNYYRNKDHLFRTVVKPATDGFGALLELQIKNNFVDIFRLSSPEDLHIYINKYVEFIKDCSDELKILFFKSRGSSLQNFKSDFIVKCCFNIRNSLGSKDVFGVSGNIISDFTIHMHVKTKFNVMEEILLQEIPMDDLEKTIKEYIYFETTGWLKLIEKKA